MNTPERRTRKYRLFQACHYPTPGQGFFAGGRDPILPDWVLTSYHAERNHPDGVEWTVELNYAKVPPDKFEGFHSTVHLLPPIPENWIPIHDTGVWVARNREPEIDNVVFGWVFILLAAGVAFGMVSACYAVIYWLLWGL